MLWVTIKTMSNKMISLTDLEAAINYWRIQCPATGEECALSPEVNALAEVYAVLIIEHLPTIAVAAIGQEPRRLLQIWRTMQ